MQAWCPLNPQSRFPKGYDVIFGEKNNPSFQPDAPRGLMRVQYQYKVGKIGLDSRAGWVATVDGESGAVFVQRFVFEPKKEYPDGSSVEFWLNGVGQIHAYNRDMVMPTNAAENPYVFESEVLSPFARTQARPELHLALRLVCLQHRRRFPGGGLLGRGRGRGAVVGGVVIRAGAAQGPLGRLCSRHGARRVCRRAGPPPAGARLAVDGFAAEAGGSGYRGGGCHRRGICEARVDRGRRNSRGRAGPGQGRPAQYSAAARWPAEKAWQWYNAQPWLVGCNFLPSTAVNDVEMWQKETFDAATIDRELGWAEQLGFNTVRVFLNFVVWREDAAGLKERFAEFLKIADRHGISVMPILLDDCNFAGRVAAVGKQPDPVPGVHNSQWVSSPPLAMVTDRAAWPALEQYVKDMVEAFGQDRRIVVWDLYNEPGNGMGEKSRPLMEAAFAWAREARPSQPLTTGAWVDFNSPFSRRMMELSDVVSFHGYDSPAEIEAKLKICAAHGRPVLCTEWLVRRGGNSFERLLPLFRDRKIGCWNWGLVAGRTQTYFPWGSPQGAPEPHQWQHDILRADGRPLQRRRGPVRQGDRRQVAGQRAAPANRVDADRGESTGAMAIHFGETGRRLVQAELRRRRVETRHGPLRHGRTALRPGAQHGLGQRRPVASPRIRDAAGPVCRLGAVASL